MKRLLVCSLAALLTLTGITAAGAAAFPEKPITIVVSSVAGGGVDVSTRFIASAGEKYLGVPVVIENKPGGSSLTGSAEVAKAKPDGYTLISQTCAVYTVAPHIYKTPYDPMKAFIPILKTGNPCMIMSAGPKAPAKTFEEFVAYAKANPGKVTVGCAGLGDISGIQCARAFKAMGIQVRIVPFGGAAETCSNLLGGHIMYGNISDGVALPHFESGKLIPFFEFGGKPSKYLKDMPTLDSLGYPGASTPYYRAIMAPAGTPREVVDVLRTAFLKMAEDPDVMKLFDNIKASHTDFSNDPEAIQKQVEEEYAMFGDVVKELGISKK